MTKQETINFHYDQPTAPSYDGWEKNKPCQWEMEKWGKSFLDLIGEERIQYNEKLSGLVDRKLIAPITMGELSRLL